MHVMVNNLLKAEILLLSSLSYAITHWNDDCRWDVDFAKVVNEHSATSAEKIDLKDTLFKIPSQIQHEHLKSFIQLGKTLSFGYMLAFTIKCKGLYSRNLSVTAGELDLTLTAHITQSAARRDGNYIGTIRNSYEAALTDKAVLAGFTPSCDRVLCEPVWVVPLSLDNDAVYIEITSEDSVARLPAVREFILVNPYVTDKHFIGNSQKISSISHLHIEAQQMTSSANPFSLMEVLPVRSTEILVTTDHWLTANLLNVSFSGIPLKSVCFKDANEKILPQDVTIKAVAVSGKQIYFATNIGLVEIEVDSSNRVLKTLTATACVNQLKVTSRPYSTVNKLLAVGEEKLEIFYSADIDQVHLHQKTLMQNKSLSEFCAKLVNCRLLDVDFHPSNQSNIIVLTEHRNAEGKYAVYNLWNLDTIDQRIELQSSLRSEFSVEDMRSFIKADEEKLDLQKVAVSCFNDCESPAEIVVDRLFIHSFSSTDILLIGTHVIHGHVGGGFYCISPPNQAYKFTLVASDSKRTAAFYTITNELFVWKVNNVRIQRIYPSIGWVEWIRLSSNAKYKNLENYTVFSMKFHLKGSLILALSDGQYNSSVLHLQIDFTKVLKLEQLYKDRADIRAASKPLSEPSCNHLRFYAEDLLQYMGFQHYSWQLFHTARGFDGYIHSFSDLLLYQALAYNLPKDYEMYNSWDTRFLNRTANSNKSSLFAPDNLMNLTKYEYAAAHMKFVRLLTDLQNDAHMLPSVIYMDKGIKAYLKVQASCVDGLERCQLAIDLAANEFLKVKTKKSIDYRKSLIFYDVELEVAISRDIAQQPPGHNLMPLMFAMRTFPNADSCSTSALTPDAAVDEVVQTMQIMIGCPPYVVPYFDLERSIEELSKFGTHLNCLDRAEELPCFAFGQEFYSFIGIRYTSSGTNRPFNGSYTIKVVGGGNSYTSIRRYSTEEIYRYNSFNQSKQNLEYLMIAPASFYPNKVHDGFPVYSSSDNALDWRCSILSECSSPPPADLGIPEFYFLLEFSNRNVDDTTLCLFEFKVIVRVFGYQVGRQNYLVLLGSMVMIVLHVIAYYFWKTRYHWLALLDRSKNPTVKRLLSIGNIDKITSQASLKKQFLDAIGHEDVCLLSEALNEAEAPGLQFHGNRAVLKEKISHNLQKVLEMQIANHDIKGIGYTIVEIKKNNFMSKIDQKILEKAKLILARKVSVVYELIESLDSQDHRELGDCLTRYKQMLPEEAADSNPLVKQATVNLTSLLTKQIVKSLKLKDTWEIHYAIKEFKSYEIPDKFRLIPKAEQVIYNRLTARLRKAVKQGTPQLLKDALVDTERDLEFHQIQDSDGLISVGKALLHRILTEKLADEMKKKDPMKIRNAINKFAFYGVTDVSGFLEKAITSLYGLVIPPLEKELEKANSPDEVNNVIIIIRAELNKYSLQDKDNISAKAEKVLYDMIAKQLKLAIKVKAKPKDLALILTAFAMSKKQYKVPEDLLQLEESAKELLYKQLVPFLLNALKGPKIDAKQLSSAIIGARIEFSRIGIDDPGNIINNAEKTLYNLTFGKLDEAYQFSKNYKEIWSAIKSTQEAVKDFGVDDKDSLMLKAGSKLEDLILSEIEEAVQRNDLPALNDIRDNLKSMSSIQKTEILLKVEQNIKELGEKLLEMNAYLKSHSSEYKTLCEEVRKATNTLRVTKNFSGIIPVITKFEKSGFPDKDGLLRNALALAADIIDQQFNKHMADNNFAKVAMLRDAVNAAAMEPKIKEIYYLLSVVCGKYLTLKSDIEQAMRGKYLDITRQVLELEGVIKNIKTLKLVLPQTYISSMNQLEEKMTQLKTRAEETEVFLKSIGDIKRNLLNLNPIDIVKFTKYVIAPGNVYSILRAFLIVLGREPESVQSWKEIKTEIVSHTYVIGLLGEAESYDAGKVGMLALLQCRDLCEPYIELVNLNETNMGESSILSIIIKWVLLTINESLTFFVDSGEDLRVAINKDMAQKTAIKSYEEMINESKQSDMFNSKELNETKELIKKCRDILRPGSTINYLVRWIRGFGSTEVAAIYLARCMEFKNKLNAWHIFHRYSAPEPLNRYVRIIEHCGTDRRGKPLFLCQFGKLDFETIIKSCSASDFMLYFIYLMEMVEYLSKQEGSSLLIIDCTSFQPALTPSVIQFFGWMNIAMIIMSQYYPLVFKTVYVISGSSMTSIAQQIKINLFENRRGFHHISLDDDQLKTELSSLADATYLPESLGGTLHADSHIHIHGRAPHGFYPLEHYQHDRLHWLTLHIEPNHKKSLHYLQKDYAPAALLYCEFKSDGAVDFEITYSSPNAHSTTSLLSLSQIDYFYSNYADASQPGTYTISFYSVHTSKLEVQYEAVLANSPSQFLEHVCKLEVIEDGYINVSARQMASF